MNTLKEFCGQSNVDAKLIRAVVRQIGGWESFTDHAKDVVDHGADGGFSGFIYHSDTLAFYARNRALIVALASEQSQEYGEGVIEMVQGFNCLCDRATRKPDYTTDEVGVALYGNKSKIDTSIGNALAWYALQEVCRSYMDVTTDGGY